MIEPYFKTGEPLVLKGTLEADEPALPWTGATAKFHARVAGASTPWRSGEAVTLDVATGAFTYPGSAPVDADANEYRAEIEVTFQDGTKKTFPVDGYIKFTILKQIA